MQALQQELWALEGQQVATRVGDLAWRLAREDLAWKQVAYRRVTQAWPY